MILEEGVEVDPSGHEGVRVDALPGGDYARWAHRALPPSLLHRAGPALFPTSGNFAATVDAARQPHHATRDIDTAHSGLLLPSHTPLTHYYHPRSTWHRALGVGFPILARAACTPTCEQRASAPMPCNSTSPHPSQRTQLLAPSTCLP